MLFHSIGVEGEEFEHQIVKGFDGAYIGYETVLFGGAGSPLVWGKAAAFLGRSGQALFDDAEARVEIYVDDPWTGWAGSAATRRRNKAILLLWWLAVGPAISWTKIQVGTAVAWIGASVVITEPSSITLAIPGKCAGELCETVDAMLAVRAVTLQDVRKLAGKAMWAAGIVPSLGSMIAPLWAAISEVGAADVAAAPARSRRRRHAPPHIPTVRIAHALRWLRAFAQRQRGTLCRTFSTVQHYGSDTAHLVFDGSPWGYGGILYINAVPVSWFAEAVAEEDVQRFGIVIGDCRLQALIETIAVLIGVRVWRDKWYSERAAITVRSDSLAALGAAAKLRSTTPAINAVVRELALGLAEGKYRIDVREHLPGALITVADVPSRLRQPGASTIVPSALGRVPRVHPPPRGHGWWETAASPAEGDGMDSRG